MAKRETVAIIGASPKPERYAFRAFEMLREYGHHAVPVNPAYNTISGEPCYPTVSDVPEQIDTITLYLGKPRSDRLIEQIILAKPRRIIMNPGAENYALADRAGAENIDVIEGCTLVMLRTGSF